MLEGSRVILPSAVEPKEDGGALKTEEDAGHHVHP